MASTMFGVVSDNYRNRLHVSYDQLDFTDGDQVIYPDLVKTNWIWFQPQGGVNFSGPGSATSSYTDQMTFKIPPTYVTDPHSYRLYFKCFVQGTYNSGTTVLVNSAGLANYAHSIFQQLTIRFSGGSSTNPEQVNNYNVFCSALYQFFSRNHVLSIHANMEGWTPPTYCSGAGSGGQSPTGFFNLGTQRIWNGKTFCLPLNLGIFMSARKFLPNFIMPTMDVIYYMETVQRATSSIMAAGVTTTIQDKNTSGTSAAGGTATPTPLNYYITNPQLLCSQITVTDEYADRLRQQVSDFQSKGTPVRIDTSSWQGYRLAIPTGTVGEYRLQVTSDITGLRKVIFGLISSEEDNSGADITVSKDSINSFYLNGLGYYRLLVNGQYYPDINISTNLSAATNLMSTDNGLAYYINAYSLGVMDNPSADLYQTWDPKTQLIDQQYSGIVSVTNAESLLLPNFVYLIKTQWDDEGLPSLRYLQKSGQIYLILDFTTAVSGTWPLNCYAFLNQSRSFIIEEGNRCQVING